MKVGVKDFAKVLAKVLAVLSKIYASFDYIQNIQNLQSLQKLQNLQNISYGIYTKYKIKFGSVFFDFFPKFRMYFGIFGLFCTNQILATKSWLLDPGYQFLATTFWLPGSGHQILDTISCRPDSGYLALAT